MIENIVIFFNRFYKKMFIFKMNIFSFASCITFLRLLLVPFIVFAIFSHRWLLAAVLFTIAAATDVLDGFVARYYGQETTLGKYLDPLADKVLLVSSIAALASANPPFFTIPLWFVWFAVLREVAMIAGGLVLLCLGRNFVIKPTIWGKATTALYVLFIILMFVDYFFAWKQQMLFHVAVILLALFSFLTLLHYANIAFIQIRKN